MNGELAQIIFLVSYGNAYLSKGAAQEFDVASNSTFKYLSSLSFSRYKSDQFTDGELVAKSVAEWFAFLRYVNVSRLWNISLTWPRQDIPEYVAAGFSGGLPTAIQAVLPGGFELWVPHWQTGGPKNKPWIVEYRGMLVPGPFFSPTPQMNEVKDNLRRAVSQALEFSKRSDANLAMWSDWFSQSLEMLDSHLPKAPYHPDFLPGEGFSMDARQLMAAAAQAYVFGGMGSWNDMGFVNPITQKEYEEITISLYAAVKSAIILASNSFSVT